MRLSTGFDSHRQPIRNLSRRLAVELLEERAMLDAPQVADAEIAYFAVAQSCSGLGQFCDVPFSLAMETGSSLQAEFTVDNHCSPVRVHFSVDSQPKGTSEFLGWPGSGGPLSTGLVNLGPISAGPHEISLQAEGQRGRCNSGRITGWSGTLRIVTSSPVGGSLVGVPDVEAQFRDLKHHGEALGWVLPEYQGAPDPSFTDGEHYQGVVRYPGTGLPVFYVTQSDKQGGYLSVVRFGTRDAYGERLRSNLLSPIADTEDTAPDSPDTWVTSFRFNGIGIQADGRTLRPYEHPGGMAIIDNVLLMAMDTPIGTGFGGTGVILLFDLGINAEFQETPQPIQVISLDHAIDNLAATKIPNGKYLVFTNGNGGEDVRFYETSTTDLRDDNLVVELIQKWDARLSTNFDGGSEGEDWPSAFLDVPVLGGIGSGLNAHQSSTFVRESDGATALADGSLYLIGMRNTSGGIAIENESLGDDFADLYKVEQNGVGGFKLTLLQKLHAFCNFAGTGRICSFAAGNSAYVSPSGELILYSIPHDDEDDADPDYVKMAEFRHRDVNRSDSPLRVPTASAAGPYVVDEGGRTAVAAAGVPAADRPWIELYDDNHFSDRSIVVDFDDRHLFQLNDFTNKLDGFNDKTTSVRWRAPVGVDIELYDDDNFRDRMIVLKGTGRTEEIADLKTQVVVPGVVEHAGKSAGDMLDFNDKTSSMRFLGSPPESSLAFHWDLDSDGTFGESGGAAELGNEIGMRPTFSATELDGPADVTVHVRVCDGEDRCGFDSTNVSIKNVAPSAAIVGPTQVFVGQPFGITMIATDPGQVDTAIGFRYEVKEVLPDGTCTTQTIAPTPGNGSGIELGLQSQLPGTHVIAVTAFDRDGAASSTAVLSIHAVGLPGDADGDGEIGFSDFVILSNNFGREGDVIFEDGDFNADRRVDFSDFVVLANSFGVSLHAADSAPQSSTVDRSDAIGGGKPVQAAAADEMFHRFDELLLGLTR